MLPTFLLYVDEMYRNDYPRKTKVQSSQGKRQVTRTYSNPEAPKPHQDFWPNAHFTDFVNLPTLEHFLDPWKYIT